MAGDEQHQPGVLGNEQDVQEALGSGSLGENFIIEHILSLHGSVIA